MTGNGRRMSARERADAVYPDAVYPDAVYPDAVAAANRALDLLEHGLGTTLRGSAELGRRSDELVGELEHRHPFSRDGGGAVPRAEQATGDRPVAVGVVAHPHDVDEYLGERPPVEDRGHREAQRVEHEARGVVVEEGLPGDREHRRLEVPPVPDRAGNRWAIQLGGRALALVDGLRRCRAGDEGRADLG